MRIVLIGGGGHASDVLGVIEDLNLASSSRAAEVEVAGILDDGEVDGTRFHDRGVRQIGTLADIGSIDASHYVVAMGWPSSRRAGLAALQAHDHDRRPAVLVHPAATVGAGVEVGEGTVVMAGVHLSPLCRIGRHACVSNRAVLGHDAIVGDLAGIMPAAVISGTVHVGEGALVGANATVLQGLRIGAWATVGAGAVVRADVAEGDVVVGVPAQPIRSA